MQANSPCYEIRRRAAEEHCQLLCPGGRRICGNFYAEKAQGDLPDAATGQAYGGDVPQLVDDAGGVEAQYQPSAAEEEEQGVEQQKGESQADVGTFSRHTI